MIVSSKTELESKTTRILTPWVLSLSPGLIAKRALGYMVASSLTKVVELEGAQDITGSLAACEVLHLLVLVDIYGLWRLREG